MGSSWIVHPFLLGLYLVFSLLAENLGEAYLDGALLSLGVMVGGAGVLLLLARAFTRDWRRAGLSASLALFVLFSFGVAQAWATRTLGPDALLARSWVILAVQAFALVLGALVLRSRPRDPAPLTMVLNVMSVVLLAFPTAKIVGYGLSPDGAILAGRDSSSALIAPELGSTLDLAGRALPDVYYIILDAHARQDVLRDLYGHDSGEFLAFLERRGFRVFEDSFSNYSATKLALPSVLNMTYLDEVAQRMGPESRDTRPLDRMRRHNRVVAIFREAGYQIINVTTGGEYYAVAGADEYLNLAASVRRPSEFESALLAMTPVPSILELLPAKGVSLSDIQRESVLYALDQLGREPSDGRPRFVLAHIFAPHAPFLFGPDGEHRYLEHHTFHEYSDAQRQEIARAYRDQTRFVQRQVMEAIERIDAGSAEPPAIIIQGDHGLRLLLGEEPADSCLVESFAILNAQRLPGVATGAAEGMDSPVNTFRVVFDAYLGSELGLLGDRSVFAHRPLHYEMADVTTQRGTCERPPSWRR